MSHFAVLVLCKDPEEVETRLDPFYEELEIEFCDKTEEVKERWAENPTIPESSEGAGKPAKEKYKTIEEFAEGWFGWESNGDGTFGCMHNPKAKWDWWSIGGRWTGLLTGYKPSEDPKNQEICNLCNGTGDRPGWVTYRIDPETGKKVREFRDDWAKKCNGCNTCTGTGQTTKWPTRWAKHDGDRMKVKDIDWSKKPKFWAILDLDGNWHEPGNMGWWGMDDASDEDKAKFDSEFHDRHIKDLDPETSVVVVDCHI